MLSPTTASPTNPILPSSLTELALSHASRNKLAITMIAIPKDLNDEATEIVPHWLTDKELTQLNQYTFVKRRHEWLSGRICAKQATIDLLNTNGHKEPFSGTDFPIIANQAGRPFLDPDNMLLDETDIDISISHSHDMAVGLAGYGRCGIDIQYLTETLFKVKHRFCADIEMAILDQLPADELVHLGLLWVAKEAIRKCLSDTRIVGFRELRLSHVHEINDHFILQFEPDLEGFAFPSSNPISVITHSDDSFAIGICTLEREISHAGTA